MALSADTVRKRRSLDQQRLGNAQVTTSVTIYKGSLVLITEGTGFARLPVSTTGLAAAVFAGVAQEQSVGVAAGTVNVDYAWGHEELITALTALTTTYRMCQVLAYDDDQVTTITAISAAKRNYVGYAVDFDSSGNAWCLIDPTAGQRTAP